MDVDISVLTNKQLQDQLRFLGLSTSGSKTVLIERLDSANQLARKREILLIEASREGNLILVRSLVKQGANKSAQYNALKEAIKFGQDRVVDYFIQLNL